MSGYQVTSTDVNNRAGQLVTAIWQDLESLKQFHLWLNDATHDSTFFTGIGIDANVLSDLRSGIGDLGNPTNGLYAVSHGIFVPGGTNNFFFNAKKLSGTNYAA